jgi:RimJ/RimL family protein N-acetyltransferase
MDEAERNIRYDKLGSPFTVKMCEPGDIELVLQMYDTYMPEPVAQGLPPADKRIRRRWIEGLLKRGENYAAVRERVVMGHAALLPNLDTSDGEYLIFVASPHRKRGLATVLTDRAVERAFELGLRAIWLTVESDNFRAIRLYRKAGFQFCDKGLSERKMLLPLQGA